MDLCFTNFSHGCRLSSVALHILLLVARVIMACLSAAPVGVGSPPHAHFWGILMTCHSVPVYSESGLPLSASSCPSDSLFPFLSPASPPGPSRVLLHMCLPSQQRQSYPTIHKIACLALNGEDILLGVTVSLQRLCVGSAQVPPTSSQYCDAWQVHCHACLIQQVQYEHHRGKKQQHKRPAQESGCWAHTLTLHQGMVLAC